MNKRNLISLMAIILMPVFLFGQETVTEEKVTEYVYKHYRSYKDKPLIIEEFGLFFTIKRNKDESPLILSKGILNE